jgi:uncharacterized protein (TIGR03000 family)
MKYRYFLIPAVLGVAGLLMSASAAHAQRGGHGGGHGGGGHSSGSFHGGHSSGSFHGGHSGHDGHGHSSVVIGFGFGGWGWGGGYGYGYGGGPYVYGYPYYPSVAYYPPAALDIDTYPSSAAPAAAPAPQSNAAYIRVMVPDGQAKVWFDGNLTKQGGTDRLFHTPTLTAGGTYSYRIRASWLQNGKEMVQEAVVPVSAGQTSTADFTRPASEGVPPPVPQPMKSEK